MKIVEGEFSPHLHPYINMGVLSGACISWLHLKFSFFCSLPLSFRRNDVVSKEYNFASFSDSSFHFVPLLLSRKSSTSPSNDDAAVAKAWIETSSSLRLSYFLFPLFTGFFFPTSFMESLLLLTLHSFRASLDCCSCLLKAINCIINVVIFLKVAAKCAASFLLFT